MSGQKLWMVCPFGATLHTNAKDAHQAWEDLKGKKRIVTYVLKDGELTQTDLVFESNLDQSDFSKQLLLSHRIEELEKIIETTRKELNETRAELLK